MRRAFGTLVIALATASLGLSPANAADAKGILSATGVTGGLVVHVGCGNGDLTAALRANAAYVVQGLDTDAANVDKVRKHARKLGLLGKVSADVFDGRHLPYADNLVNLLVAEDLGKVPMAEVMRVLAPGGVAYIAGKKTVKPLPENIDEWTHYLHGADNNAVAMDTVVGPPRHMQWLGGPRWTRNHHKLNSISSVVTAKGMLFYIVDNATAANMSIPGKWAIAARDAFSGVKLWDKPLASWTTHTGRFRSGPPQVTRLLVAWGDRLYAPLALSAPVSAVDAVTGKTLATYKDTAGAEEIVLAGNALLVLTGNPVAEHAAGHPAFRGKLKLPNTKTIVAVDVESGRTLWKWSPDRGSPMPETLGSDGRRVYVQVNESVACLDLKSGKKLWTSGQQAKPKSRGRGRRGGYGKYTLVVADDVVLCKLSGMLTALSAKDGKKLWDCKAGGGFHAPLDVFVIDGVVWQGLHTSDSVAPPPVKDFNEGRDLKTGKVVKTNTIAVDLQTAGHHHRCYREKATVRYIITGKRGVEMMDMTGDNSSRNNWVRGTCQYGMLPANGLIYAPSHSCGCYMESKLWGFWALAADRPVLRDPARKVPDAQRLQKGPAYSEISNLKSQISDGDWPQYRRDARRSGVAATVLHPKLTQAWQAKIGGRLTQPVVAGGKVVLAAVDAGTVFALDEKTGKVAWEYSAGGRVDSPPAVHNAIVLFGSADGRVTCLRLSDGELVWRFLAAPRDIKTVAMDQVESLWPVHGSVLVLNGVAYCAAGRSTWLDTGIYLYGLDPATGKVLCTSHFQSTHPRLGEGKDKAKPQHKTRVAQNTTDYKTFLAPDHSDSFSMAGGSVADVLVSDGRDVFMHHVRFDAKLARQEAMSRHLFSTSGLLDDAENHRSHWVLGTGDFSRVAVAYSWIVNSPGRWNPGIAVPTGLMMVYSNRAVWAAQRRGIGGKYVLTERPNRPFSADEKPLPDFRKLPKNRPDAPRWTVPLPVRPRAMLKSGPNLYLGVVATGTAGDDPHAPYEGRTGGTIWVASATDGSKVAEYKIDSPVVWDGLAAANGKLYAATMNGKVLCYEASR